MFVSIFLFDCVSLLFIDLSVCLFSFNLSICLSIYISICLSIWLHITFLPINLFIYLSKCLSICLSVVLNVYVYINTINMFVYKSTKYKTHPTHTPTHPRVRAPTIPLPAATPPAHPAHYSPEPPRRPDAHDDCASQQMSLPDGINHIPPPY